MGCDIHLKLEYRAVKPRPTYFPKFNHETGEQIGVNIYESKLSDSEPWYSASLTRHEFSDRVYGMFTKLAGVRGDEEKQLVPLRGFPEDATFSTIQEYGCRVVSDEEYERNEKFYDYSEHHYCSETKAKEWLEKGYSKEIKINDRYISNSVRYISDPDWHTPSWCTTEEMEKCVKSLFWDEEKKVWHGDFVEWIGLLGAMKGIEDGGYYECRAVFWFDN